ncbi:MAG: CsbD family protein, partial [Janthinobacterium lividum]
NMDEDRVDGALKKMGGSIKEVTGKIVGDTKLEADGKADKVEGKVQNTVGGAKDAIRGDA